MAVIHIHVTDGEITRRVARISYGKTIAFLSAEDDGDTPPHFTYHDNGLAHFNADHDGRQFRVGRMQGPPLDEFEGFISTGYLWETSSINETTGSEYDPDKTGSHIMLRGGNEDVQSRFIAYLVNPNFPVEEIILRTRQRYHQIRDIEIHPIVHLVTVEEPWIAIFEFDQGGPAELLPSASQHFEILPDEVN